MPILWGRWVGRCPHYIVTNDSEEINLTFKTRGKKVLVFNDMWAAGKEIVD
jgi:hypothetical protein